MRTQSSWFKRPNINGAVDSVPFFISPRTTFTGGLLHIRLAHRTTV